MVDPIIQRAIAAYESGAWGEAESACNEALRANPQQADALQVLGNIRARSGDTRAAEPLLERARAAAPANIFILNSLGGVYAANGRPKEARIALEAALRIDAGFPWALQNLGSLLLEAGEFKGARRCFELALAGSPNHVDAIAALADLSEKEQKLDAADALVKRALAIAPQHPGAALVRARLELRAGDPSGAEASLRALLASGALRPVNQAIALSHLGQALEGLGRYDEAFATIAAANDIERAFHAPLFAGTCGAVAPATIARLTEFMQVTDPAAWPKPAVDGLPEPVFLVGFPRSGTTLLEQVLATHPCIATLEEQEILAQVAAPLLETATKPDGWSGLSSAELSAFRNGYWQQVDARLGRARDGRVVVDKLPLNLALLPIIHLLFPDARIILALRDPRDVIVSCLRNRFAMNVAMYQFLSLETAASYYDDVMSLARLARERLPLAIHELRYEDLIDDLRGQVERLLEFLGLAWADEVLNHVETARRRQIRTPSAAQVVRPIYRTSIAQWGRYERELAPAMPVLERWVRAFGYETGAG